MNRLFLLTTFRCAACGGPLGLHDPQIEQIKGPTGADQVAATFYISPCYTCQQPLRDLANGVAKLRKVLKDDKYD